MTDSTIKTESQNHWKYNKIYLFYGNVKVKKSIIQHLYSQSAFVVKSQISARQGVNESERTCPDYRCM